jgi:uncharacterized protein (TIGR02001 family)
MQSMLKRLLPVVVLATTVSMPAIAAEPFGPGSGDVSATVGVTSQYVFRGLAQTDEHPAVQASIDYTHDSGVYAGVWGSNVDFQDGDEANLETDIYGGWSGEISSIAWDIGGIYYWYPGADSDLDYDYFELAVSAGYDFDFANVSAAVNYSPNYFADSGDAWYLAGNVEVPLPKDFKITGHVGHQYIDDNDNFGSPDYTDWSVGVGYTFYGFDLSLNYIDTDLDDGDECVKGWCDDRVVFSVSHSFE